MLQPNYTRLLWQVTCVVLLLLTLAAVVAYELEGKQVELIFLLLLWRPPNIPSPALFFSLTLILSAQVCVVLLKPEFW